MTDVSNNIENKLDKLIDLVALGLVTGKSQREQIKILTQASFSPKEIANLIGTTANTVSVNLTSIRKENKKIKKK
jgi:DNA-binding CsgD family transcriptional regulator